MNLKAVIEAILLAAQEPVTLTQLVKTLEDKLPDSSRGKEAIRETLETLAADYDQEDRGVSLVEVGGGYQLRTKPEYGDFIRQLEIAKPPRLSTPAIESLAIIAYRQPITRGEVDQIRGVDSGGVIKTLLERRLIKIVGRKEELGRPLLYATTPVFLELFGLKDLRELPPLQELEEKAAALLEKERTAESMTPEELEALEVDTELLSWMDEQERETFAELSNNLKELRQTEQRAKEILDQETPAEAPEEEGTTP